MLSWILSSPLFLMHTVCVVMSFLVLWSIYWNSSLLHFKKSPKYLMKGQPGYLFVWWDFCYVIWFWIVFSFSRGFIFFFFLSSAHVWWHQLSIFLGNDRFPFLLAFWFFLDLVILSFQHLLFSAFHYYHGTFFHTKFHPNILTVYPHCLYLMLSMYMRWLIFSCDLWSFNPPVYYLSIWLSGIIIIKNCNSDSVSTRKIPLWIFISVTLFFSVISSTLQFCIVFAISFIRF